MILKLDSNEERLIEIPMMDESSIFYNQEDSTHFKLVYDIEVQHMSRLFLKSMGINYKQIYVSSLIPFLSYTNHDPRN
jgi:hypothetical protein